MEWLEKPARWTDTPEWKINLDSGRESHIGVD